MKSKQFEENVKLAAFRAITDLLAENGLATPEEAEKIHQRIMKAQVRVNEGEAVVGDATGKASNEPLKEPTTPLRKSA